MMRRAGLLAISLVLAVSSLLLVTPPQKAAGAISACSVTMSPHKVEMGSSTTYRFELTNNDPDTIQWIRIARPTNQFALSSATATGWSASLSADNATFRWGGLNRGDTLVITVNATVNSSVNGTFNWTLFVTDDPDGAGQFACDGDLSITVGDPPPPPVAISNLSVTGITENSATVKWTTNIPSKSRVYYGSSAQYGKDTGLSSAFVTNHSVQIAGLSASAVYHYMVTNESEAGASVSSADSTFKTASPLAQDDIPEEYPLNPIRETTTETIPPTVRFTSDITGAYKETPTFTGVASDNEAIALLEYSVDGGNSWLPVDHVERTFSLVGGRRVVTDKEVTFEFTPVNLEDGDYMVMVRATDTSRNRASTPPVRLVIDRLPPQVGGSMISIGPHVLESRNEGVFSSVVGVEQKITLSAVGGPTEIILTATAQDNPSLNKTFSLYQDKVTGLWSGPLHFDHPATYELESTAIDGAGNVTRRALESVHVAPSATVVAKGSNQSLEGVNVTLHYFVPQTNSWAIWDGAAYGQSNPQSTNDQGQFNYFLPPGKYYLELRKTRYRTVYSHMFTLDKPLPLSSTVSMDGGIGFTVVSRPIYLPGWSTVRLDVNERTAPISKGGPTTLIGKQLPNFALPDAKSGTVASAELSGKRTLVSFIATWSPAAKNQLPILSKVQMKRDINVVPIVVQESTGKVNAYLNLAGYQLTVAVDKDGVTVPDFMVQGIPLHIFVDETGFVKKVMVGVLSEQDIKEGMGE